MIGRLVGARVQEGRPIPDGSGTYPAKFVVSVLNGDRTVQIEYKNEEAAFEALREFDPGAPDIHSIKELIRVVLPIGIRSAKGFTFYFGRRVAAGVSA